VIPAVATLGSGLKDSVTGQFDEQANADYVVTSTADEGQFGTGADDALAATPGVEIASSVRSDMARILGESTNAVGVDPTTIGKVYRFDGSAARTPR
jgi:hypothetical protein